MFKDKLLGILTYGIFFVCFRLPSNVESLQNVHLLFVHYLKTKAKDSLEYRPVLRCAQERSLRLGIVHAFNPKTQKTKTEL